MFKYTTHTVKFMAAVHLVLLMFKGQVMLSKDEEREGWHLDKRVPISILAVLLFQGVSGIWVIADMRKDIEVVKMQLLVQRERDTTQDRLLTENSANQVRALTEVATLLRAQLDRIENKVDRNVEQRAQGK